MDRRTITGKRLPKKMSKDYSEWELQPVTDGGRWVGAQTVVEWRSTNGTKVPGKGGSQTVVTQPVLVARALVMSTSRNTE